LFGKYDFCINLGGFSNVSFHKNNKRIAFDICAVNTVLNHYTQKIGFDYDMDGKIAITGTINLDLLKALNSLAFYHLKPPKSLGIENVNRTIIPLIDSFSDNIPIILATFCEHIAIQIKNVLPDERCLVLLSGGGTYNRFLIERLQKTAELVDFEIPSQKIIDFKEALIFGLLGVLRIRNEINVLSSVTGASKDHVAGYIF
jgi:anhydro-N-acetylmuramic acid kinase